MKIFAITAQFLLIAAAATVAQAQPRRFPDPMREEPPPKAIRNSLEKMRIEDAKKDFAEMLKRGEDAVKLATDLEERVAINGRLSETELEKVNEVEKLVKKIRGELGGSDGDDDDEEEAPPATTTKDAVGALRKAAVSLYDELKKASRFTVSATAIKTTNAILKVARFLTITN